jgi:hypothetical protein
MLSVSRKAPEKPECATVWARKTPSVELHGWMVVSSRAPEQWSSSTLHSFYVYRKYEVSRVSNTSCKVIFKTAKTSGSQASEWWRSHAPAVRDQVVGKLHPACTSIVHPKPPSYGKPLARQGSSEFKVAAFSFQFSLAIPYENSLTTFLSNSLLFITLFLNIIKSLNN